jgi:hypothetical protein
VAYFFARSHGGSPELHYYLLHTLNSKPFT